MAYRDEAEALRARVDQLERDNDALRRENATLRGEPVPRGARAASVGERLLGGRLVLTEARELDVELPPSGHEDVLEVLRSALGTIGETSVVGSTIAWRVGPPTTQRVIEVMISAREGRTLVRAIERLGGLAGGLFGGVVGGAGGGGLGVIAPLAAMVDPTLALVAAPAWVAAVYTIVRSGYASTARRREKELAALADALARAVRTAADREEDERGRSARVRVEEPTDGGEARAEGPAARRRART